MRHPRRVLGAMVPMLLFGIIAVYRHSENLLQVSQDVTIRDIIGLTAGGATCGAALTGVVVALVSRNRAPEGKLPTLDRQLP